MNLLASRPMGGVKSRFEFGLWNRKETLQLSIHFAERAQANAAFSFWCAPLIRIQESSTNGFESMNWTGESFSSASRWIISSVSGWTVCLTLKTGTPDLMIPALFQAISRIVGPNGLTCSIARLVIPHTRGCSITLIGIETPSIPT